MFKLFGFVDDTKAMNTKGVGLGLAISKHIVEQFDGQISVISEVGLGSNFTFKIRLEDSESTRSNSKVCLDEP